MTENAATSRLNMNRLRWLLVLGILLVCTSAAFADGTAPPDGSVGVKNTNNSIPIFTTSTVTINFAACPGAGADCTLFGTGTQFVFGGRNESGQAWNELTVTLDLTAGDDAGNTLGCATSSVFTVVGGQCGQVIGETQTTATAEFFQGTGTGIGCYGDNFAADVSCFLNSINTASMNQMNGTSNPYDAGPEAYNPETQTCQLPSGAPAGAVCGSNDFAIGLGFATNPENPNGQHWVSDITTGSISANSPEPSTFFLAGGAMLAMLLFGLRKS
jgi:hypothetical protein